MQWMRDNAGRWLGVGLVLAAAVMQLRPGCAQSPTAEKPAAQTAPVQTPAAQKPTAEKPTAPPELPSSLPGAGQGMVLDKVIAVVNSDLILESDVDEEQRFEEIQPYQAVDSNHSREFTVRRLIDRTLVLQQAEIEPETAVSDKELDAQLTTLRKDIAACRQYHCETDAGWAKYVNDHGFTVEEFRTRWQQRMELLKFIEVRFRNGIQISDEDIKTYYEKTMLPEYAKRQVTPPKLEAISPRIEEVLLQQQVGNLLRDWLTSLRAQGRVRIMSPGEVAP
jgi:peptidyl-prolyl cis-trans isomerase SurA